MSGNQHTELATPANNNSVNRNNNNLNATTKNRVLRLDDLAFKAFLRARKDLDFETTPVHDAVIKQYVLKLASPFLQCIADGNQDGAKKFLEDCPDLAVLACGTVTTCSENIYPNHTAIELAYVLDDVEMCKMMLPYIQKLPAELIKIANEQLTKKMVEVEKQRAQFKPYDFSEIVKAITADQTLKDTGIPNAETKMALTKFKKDFEPDVINFGKSFIKEHLQEGFHVYDQNWDPWNGNQLIWYLINIIGHKQTRAEKCFEQACSQGLKEVVDEQKPLRRSSKIKNYVNDLPLSYRGSSDSSLLLGRDFFVEIYYGTAASWMACYVSLGRDGGRPQGGDIEKLCRATRSGMEKFKQQLVQHQPSHQLVLDRQSQGCQIM